MEDFKDNSNVAGSISGNNSFTVNETPEIPVITTDLRREETISCDGETYDVTATSYSVGAPVYIETNQGPQIALSPFTFPGQGFSGTYTYSATAKIGSCESLMSSLVIEVNKNTYVELLVDKNFVENGERILLTATAYGYECSVDYFGLPSKFETNLIKPLF